MDLEEKSLEQIGDRCEECGAKLTPAEIEAAMESGGPALCTVHADEVVPVGDEDDGFGGDSPTSADRRPQPPIVSTIFPSLPPSANRS